MLKFLLVGDSDVGKDEIVAALVGTSSFPALTTPKVTTILLEGKLVTVQLWDASGQGRFSTIVKSCSRGVQGILIVYDITNRWSFNGIKRWLAEIEEHALGVPRILIGNRLHLEFNRAVERREAECFARKRNMQYYEVSTLAFFNVRESITELARLVVARNGLHCLWKNNHAASLQDLCCRVIVKSVPNAYAIESLPLPNPVKFKVRSFVSGAQLCMKSITRRGKMRSKIGSAPKCFNRLVKPLYTLFHHRRTNCSFM